MGSRNMSIPPEKIQNCIDNVFIRLKISRFHDPTVHLVMLTRQMLLPSPSVSPSPSSTIPAPRPFPVRSQLFHVYKSDENQLDHVFTRRKNFERRRTFVAENAPVFAMECGNWRLCWVVQEELEDSGVIEIRLGLRVKVILTLQTFAVIFQTYSRPSGPMKRRFLEGFKI